MRMDKLTSKFQLALSDAQSLAVGRDHQFIEPVHVLTALLDQAEGTARPLLAQANVNIKLLRAQLNEALDRLPRVEGAGGDVQISNALSRLLNQADKLAQQRKDAYISSELWRRWTIKVNWANCCARLARARRCSNAALTRCAAARRSRIRTPKISGRRWRSTRLISPNAPSRANSIR
jgi:ATP-dependent Clp protease ATP-binding subunit ClpA